MHVIRARNVHAALPAGLSHLASVGIPMPSRAGNVITAPGPVTTVYERPTERVLSWEERDANPFLHLFESLWLLAGRNDLAFLTKFVKRFEQFSDDGKTLRGAYGHRWRHHWPIDQIDKCVELLKAQPFSRRAVISMWDPAVDLLTDEGASKDVPCNTTIAFTVGYGERDKPNRLSMTVFCRSNDLIWGCAGANAVHFSFLLEYMAARLGLTVGNYYQVSVNLHAYEDVFRKTYRGALREVGKLIVNPYASGEVAPFPIVQNPATWDRDLALFFEDPKAYGYDNPVFPKVIKPLFWAHAAFKKKDHKAAMDLVEQCQATDWHKAAKEWLERRVK